WMNRIDAAFGRQFVGGFVVATPDVQQAAVVEAGLRARAEDEPGADKTTALFRKVDSIQSYVPRDQPEKLNVLAKIRKLLDDEALEAIDPGDSSHERRVHSA